MTSPPIDDVPVRQRSGAFLEHAWDVLRTVPAGAPVTYTEYAAKSGRPAAVRAAAAACARNAAALFVPCHRVRAHRRHARRVPLGAAREARCWTTSAAALLAGVLTNLFTRTAHGSTICSASLAEIVGARVHPE